MTALIDLFDLDLYRVLQHLLKLSAAALLTLPIGWDREVANRRRLGLRTFPLVSMASCGYVLVAQSVVSGDALARVIQGLITGIGFLGGGAIVKQGLDVHGTATAASIWATAAIGAAVAFGRLEIAVALGLATFASLYGLTPVKEKIAEVEGDDVGDREDEPQD